MNSFIAPLLSTATTSTPPKSRSSLEIPVQDRGGRDQQDRKDGPREHVDRIVISKINCSKNDRRSVGKISAEPNIGKPSAIPRRQDGKLRVSTGKRIVCKRFQFIERRLH